MRSISGRISPYRLAIVIPADLDHRQKTRLDYSRFARTAAALAEKIIAVEGAPSIADDVEKLREQPAADPLVRKVVFLRSAKVLGLLPTIHCLVN